MANWSIQIKQVVFSFQVSPILPNQNKKAQKKQVTGARCRLPHVDVGWEEKNMVPTCPKMPNPYLAQTQGAYRLLRHQFTTRRMSYLVHIFAQLMFEKIITLQHQAGSPYILLPWLSLQCVWSIYFKTLKFVTNFSCDKHGLNLIWDIHPKHTSEWRRRPIWRKNVEWQVFPQFHGEK